MQVNDTIVNILVNAYFILKKKLTVNSNAYYYKEFSFWIF